jgi:DNA topoisomerase-3
VGKVLLNPGWMVVYGKEAQEDDAPRLAPVEPEERVQTTGVEVKPNQTKPPPRYTEATLLTAMEGAGKLVDDDELREAMREKGLGTPATRAAIIEGLVYEQYIHRHGRELQPTAKAFSLMELLNGLGVPELTKPELTGDWEFKLRQIQRRQKSRAEFMAEIAEMTRHIVERAKHYEHDTIPGDFGVLQVPCPKCGGEVHEKYKAYQCVRCDFALWKIISGRMFEIEEVEALIHDRQAGPLQGFRSRMGKPFAAVLKMNAEYRVEFDFGGEKKQEDGSAPAEVDFTGKEPLGACPKCGGRVFENGMNYVCERSVGAAKSCSFRTGAVILQQAVSPDQVKKLLQTSKTDLLNGFVSKKTGRKFEAFLVLKQGEVGFEFKPRPSKGPAKARQPAEPPPKLDFTGQEPLGQCPRCRGRVFEGPEAYVCEKSQAPVKPCRFKTNKTILQQPVDRAQVRKLLAEGKTDLLTQFVSAKTGRSFQAYLVLQEGGKTGFEFPPRDEKP